jgi:predicted glycogen debranching enzyme
MRETEWLETDGLGGFACGSVDLVRRRRYHGLLVAASDPPAGRTMLLNGLDAWLRIASGSHLLSPQHYAPDNVTAGAAVEAFEAEPWPRWTLRAADGTRLVHEVFMRHGGVLALSWRLVAEQPGVRLCVRPFFSGRAYHALHHENGNFHFEPIRRRGDLCWRPYEDVPSVTLRTAGAYRHEPHWYRNFLYTMERERGFDCAEDLAAPGVFEFDLSAGEACILASAQTPGAAAPPAGRVHDALGRLRRAEKQRREAFPTPLHRAADRYLVKRGEGLSVIAGYPWFADWGRDTFIAIRGLCLATGCLEETRQVLLAWSGAVSEGMLPNRFADTVAGGVPEYNSVDASLWFVVAVHEFLTACAQSGFDFPERDHAALREAVLAIVCGYESGTRYGIRATADGLLAAGEPGQQLTWMDARAWGREVTPRIGKPVEVQALWLNALQAAAVHSPRLYDTLAKGMVSFRERFWNAERGCLYDVVDAGHEPGRVDAAIRPNQVFAVGGLPMALLEGERARRVVDVLEEKLWTPLGLRTLAPGEPGYAGRYEGGPDQRDAAYHQGTAWPWLAGPFVEAWLRVRGSTPQAIREAGRKFIEPLRAHLGEAGIGHVSECADGDPPHAPRGCPFQAWSVGELLRLEESVLAERAAPARATAATP